MTTKLIPMTPEFGLTAADPTFFEWLERDRIPELKDAAARGDQDAAEKSNYYRRLLTRVYIGNAAPEHYECPELSYFDMALNKWGNA